METSAISTRSATTHGATRGSVVTAAVVTAIIASVPLAALCGLLFRFPVPFAGFMSGWDAVRATPLVIFFYGIMLGGFLALAGLAALLALCFRLFRSQRDAGDSFTDGVVAGLASAAIGVALLANWDFIYGPW
jgi:hypothetical protein